MPKNYDRLTDIPWAEVAKGEVTFYTPDDLAALLKCARAEMVPCVAIAAFSGMRQEELARLDWG